MLLNEAERQAVVTVIENNIDNIYSGIQSLFNQKYGDLGGIHYADNSELIDSVKSAFMEYAHAEKLNTVHERQPIEEWCEDQEQFILSTAKRAYITISDTAPMSELVSVVHNCPVLYDQYMSDTAPPVDPAPVSVARITCVKVNDNQLLTLDKNTPIFDMVRFNQSNSEILNAIEEAFIGWGLELDLNNRARDYEEASNTMDAIQDLVMLKDGIGQGKTNNYSEL